MTCGDADPVPPGPNGCRQVRNHRRRGALGRAVRTRCGRLYRPVVGSWADHPGFAFVAGQGGSGIETAPALAAAVVAGEPLPADVPVDPAALAPAARRAPT